MVVVRKVGLGMAALRRMIRKLFDDSGAWSKNARQILFCIARMAQLEGQARANEVLSVSSRAVGCAHA